MKKNKRLLCLIMTALLLAGNLFVLRGYEAKASQRVQVILDGALVPFGSAVPQIINDRTMVPFRAIGEAMGASVHWDDASRRVTMFLNNRYVWLSIGNSVMTYGTFSTDAGGAVVYNSTVQTTLDAPPMIINNSTMVPVRAIGDGLGATTSWNGQTYTVYIISPAVPADIPGASPTANAFVSPPPSPAVDPFAYTQHFEVLSPRRAQQLYDANEKYVLVYYSSTDVDSMQYVPMIKEVARSLGFKIYGVDAEEEYQLSGGYAGTADYRVNFIWNYVSQQSMRYPTVFLVYGKQSVIPLIRPTTSRMVEDYLYDFFHNLNTPSFSNPGSTPPYSGVGPTPYLPPVPTQNVNEHWIELGSINQAINMYDDDESFILVYYWNGDDLTEDLLQNVIKPASISIGTDIYGLDARTMSREDLERSWWARDAYPTLNVKYPAVFLVTSGAVTHYISADNIRNDCHYYFDTWKQGLPQGQ